MCSGKSGGRAEPGRRRRGKEGKTHPLLVKRWGNLEIGKDVKKEGWRRVRVVADGAVGGGG